MELIMQQARQVGAVEARLTARPLQRARTGNLAVTWSYFRRVSLGRRRQSQN